MSFNPTMRRQPKGTPPTVNVNPHSVHLLGAKGSPIYRLTIDQGAEEPVHIIHLTADLAHILRNHLNQKLG